MVWPYAWGQKVVRQWKRGRVKLRGAKGKHLLSVKKDAWKFPPDFSELIPMANLASRKVRACFLFLF
jgi:hypothetical protein